jgi:uncharacterized membrane protein YqaE (UPF0057 family)
MRSLLLFISFIVLSISTLSAAVIVDPSGSNNQSSTPELHSKQKKQKLTEFKKRMKSLKKHHSADDRKVLLAILAVIIPPLAVFIHQNDINTKFWVSVILTLCFWIPGVIYSLLVVLDAI